MSDSTQEAWRSVVRNPNYEVSDLGRVRRTATGRILKARPTKKGYHMVALYGCSPGPWRQDRSVHSLVAEAFLGARPRGLEVNHKDGCKGNNALHNLEYLTPDANQKHGYALGLMRKAKGAQQGASVLDEAKVIAIAEAKFVRSQRQLAEDYDVAEATISAIHAGRNWGWLTKSILERRNACRTSPLFRAS